MVIAVVAAAVAGVVGLGRSVTKVNAEGLADVAAVVSLGGPNVVEVNNDDDVLKNYLQFTFGKKKIIV